MFACVCVCVCVYVCVCVLLQVGVGLCYKLDVNGCNGFRCARTVFTEPYFVGNLSKRAVGLFYKLDVDGFRCVLSVASLTTNRMRERR